VEYVHGICTHRNETRERDQVRVSRERLVCQRALRRREPCAASHALIKLVQSLRLDNIKSLGSRACKRTMTIRLDPRFVCGPRPRVPSVKMHCERGTHQRANQWCVGCANPARVNERTG
jgi:hypothetical protein